MPTDMARQFTEKRLVIASHNPGKVREIGELLTSVLQRLAAVPRFRRLLSRAGAQGTTLRSSM